MYDRTNMGKLQSIEKILYFLVALQPSCSLCTGNWSLDNGLGSPRNWQLVYSTSWMEQLQIPRHLWVALPSPSRFLCINKLIQPHLLWQRNSSFRCIAVEFTLPVAFCMNATLKFINLSLCIVFLLVLITWEQAVSSTVWF